MQHVMKPKLLDDIHYNILNIVIFLYNKHILHIIICIVLI